MLLKILMNAGCERKILPYIHDAISGAVRNSFGGDKMRFFLVPVLAVGLAFAGCSTDTTESGTAMGAGAATGGAGSQSAAVPGGGGVSSSQLDAQARMATQEYFVTEVGDRVFFGFDRYDLSQSARETLERQAAWLKQYPEVTVTIEGHTDERGTREYNLALGDRRANSVRNYLIALGIDPNRVTTISFGKERPVDPRSAEEAWEHNRRGVTIVKGARTSQVSN